MNYIAFSLNGIVPGLNVTEALNATQETNLRNISGALVTTYTYKPLVGVETITDPNGRTITYNYDDFGRLKEIQNQDGNILKSYEYNYAEPVTP